MASEIQCQHTVADLTTVYAIVRSATGTVWNGSAFETYATANLGTYDIALTEQGTSSRYYAGNFPAVAAGTYGVTVFVQAGGAPAETDTMIAAGNIEWNGSAVQPTVKLADAVTHGGTTAKLRLGSTSGNALHITYGGGADGAAVKVEHTGTSATGAGGAVSVVGGAAVGLYASGSTGVAVDGTANAVVVTGSTGDIVADVTGNLSTALVAIAGYIDTEVAAILAAVDTEVAAIKTVTDQLVAAQAEPVSVPAANATPLEKLAWLGMLARNKITQTATTQLVRNDADSATVGTATVSDDGTTGVRGKFS